MKSLQDFFDAQFDDVTITHDRLANFADDNILKMTDNNPAGYLNGEIAGTQTAVNNLRAAIKKTASDKGGRKGGTSDKDKERGLLEVYVGNQIGGARANFGGKDTKGYIETFPDGMDSFYKVTNADFTTNMETLIEKVTKYVAILGTPFLNTLTTMYATYKTANDEQKGDTTNVENDIENENAMVVILEDQLMDNLLTIAKANKRSLTAEKLYFNKTLLFSAKTKELKRGKPAAEATVLIPIEYSAGKRVHAYNKGATVLTIGMMLEGVKVGETVTLAPNKKSKDPFSFYFTNADTLYVFNDDKVNAGIYQIYIVS